VRKLKIGGNLVKLGKKFQRIFDREEQMSGNFPMEICGNLRKMKIIGEFLKFGIVIHVFLPIKLDT